MNVYWIAMFAYFY